MIIIHYLCAISTHLIVELGRIPVKDPLSLCPCIIQTWYESNGHPLPPSPTPTPILGVLTLIQTTHLLMSLQKKLITLSPQITCNALLAYFWANVYLILEHYHYSGLPVETSVKAPWSLFNVGWWFVPRFTSRRGRGWGYYYPNLGGGVLRGLQNPDPIPVLKFSMEFTFLCRTYCWSIPLRQRPKSTLSRTKRPNCNPIQDKNHALPQT